MRRPRGARVVASRGLELKVTDRGSGTLAASALARHSEATRVSHDALGRPVSTADSESAARTWTYNERSEMTGCTSSDGSYSYFYDSIGNRTSSSSALGNLVSVTHSYTANGLNQYDYVDSTALTYDADGNLTGDGRYSYAYDCENRLVSATPTSPQFGDFAMENAYDHRSRRVQKTVWIYDGEDWLFDRQHTFVWDGWNIVLERIDYADFDVRFIEYYWGDDLSGSEQGAGGVGGLLAVSCDGTFYVPFYDCNGNIMGYVDEFGNVVARYAYDPFGKVVTSFGGTASPAAYHPSNLDFYFGFSTKYHDREVGLIAYQLRSYSPRLGRWLNRDPIEEEGGVNLYGFVDNEVVYRIDAYGLWKGTKESYGFKRRVYKKSRDVKSLKSLANRVGLDIESISEWGRIETSPVASETSSSPITPTTPSSKYCYVSVPNIWIEADLLRGGNVYNRVIVNPGGTIGSFFGQTLGRWGYHTVKPKTPKELFRIVGESGKNLYGLTVYAHGSTNGYIVSSDERMIHQTRLTTSIRSKGYRIARANMMQCYSAIPFGSIPVEQYKEMPFDYTAEWKKTAVKFFGYEGMNIIGIDF